MAEPFDVDPHRLRRNSDPAASHLSADSNRVGRMSHRQRLMNVYIQAWPDGLTHHQAADRAGIDRVEAARRIADLKNDGHVEPVCDSSGEQVMTMMDNGRPGGLVRYRRDEPPSQLEPLRLF